MSECLVNVYRNGVVESFHRGSAAVVNHEGKLLYAVGDPYFLTYMRSAAKPLQAIPIVESGALKQYSITERELATIVASHSGEPIHIDAVQSILNKIGLDESYLKCGTHLPYHEEAKQRLLEKGKGPTPIYNNCSGKHSGMLLLSKMKGYPLETYYEQNHPLQKEVLATIMYMTEYDAVKVGTDGCGVPVFGMPLYNMALGFARFSSSESLEKLKREATKTIVNAMQQYPKQVAGTERLDTDLMSTTKNLVCKAGAEAVHCIGLPEEGVGIALKIDDGGSRARGPATVEILKQLDVLTKKELRELKNHHKPLNTNHHGEKVGRIVPEFELHSLDGANT